MNDSLLFSQKAPSKIFDWVVNMQLLEASTFIEHHETKDNRSNEIRIKPLHSDILASFIFCREAL